MVIRCCPDVLVQRLVAVSCELMNEYINEKVP